jgi:hypothetical protein
MLSSLLYSHIILSLNRLNIMSSETFKELIIDLITCLSKDQLKAVLGNISESNLGEIMRALVAEKERKGNEVKQVEKEVEMEVEKEVETEVKIPVEAEKEVVKVVKAKERIIARAKAPKEVVYGRRNTSKAVAAVREQGKTGTRSKKRKRESNYGIIVQYRNADCQTALLTSHPMTWSTKSRSEIYFERRDSLSTIMKRSFPTFYDSCSCASVDWIGRSYSAWGRSWTIE